MSRYYSTAFCIYFRLEIPGIGGTEQSALDGTESRARTGELPESCFPAWHPVLHSFPRGEMGQVLGFHKPIKDML